MRFRWGYLEVLGGIVAISGTAVILPSCSLSNNWYFYVFQCVNATTVFGREGDIGLLIALGGAALFVVGEVGRRMNTGGSTIGSGDSVELVCSNDD